MTSSPLRSTADNAAAVPSSPNGPRWSRRTLLGATGLLASTGLLTACGVGAQGGDQAGEVAPQTANSASASSAAWNLPDPRSLTGLSTAEEVASIVPIAERPTQSLPVSVTDAEGNAVTVTDARRVLALDVTGTLSRTVAGLGLAHTLVGRAISSTETELADLPVVTTQGHELNTEAILALEPTVVLTDLTIGTRDIYAQLAAAGVTIVYTNADRSLDTLSSDIQAVAMALGVPEQGTALAQRSEQELAEAREQIAQWAPTTPMRAAFLYVRGTAGIFFILGKGEAASTLLPALGLEDSASAQGLEGIVPATAEAVAQLDPEVILVMSGGLESTGGLDGLLQRPGVAQTRAGANQRIVALPDGQSLAFGPQSGQILLSAAQALYQPTPA